MASMATRAPATDGRRSAAAARRRVREREIIAATRALFDERGIREAQIDDIAHAVGINRAIVYRHFSGKEELFALTLVSYLDELHEALQGADRPDAPAPARLGVKSWEFGFTLSAKEIPAGDTIVELSNQGEDSHDLHIQRVDGGETLAAPETDPGGINRIRFTTTPGTYRLWCSLPFHAQRGMDTTITVD